MRARVARTARRIALFIIALFIAAPLWADPLTCTVAGYRAADGLTASVANDVLTATWDGDQGQEVRMRLAIASGVPTIQELAVRPRGNGWKTIATGLTPDFRIVTGLRRVTEQQLQPLRQLKTEITPALVDSIKWDAFWDAPLNLEKLEDTRMNAIPPPDGVANQPGLPRKPEEIARASATFASRGCEVTTNGGRLEISFDGAQLGVFTGRLQYTVYKGTNLIKQEIVAKTDVDSVAYKYEAGLKGLAGPASIAGGVARYRRHVAGVPARRHREHESCSPAREQPARRRRSAGRLDRRVPAAAQLLLVARGRVQPRIRLVPQGQRHDLLLRRAAARCRGAPRRDGPRRGRHAAELRAAQRAPRHVAADADLPLRHRHARRRRGARRSGVHARRSIQAAARLPGDGDALPHLRWSAGCGTWAGSTRACPISTR